jgi:predicted house-cleaning noncanonical NTP pyrophosphatase (MazG superfamily)
MLRRENCDLSACSPKSDSSLIGKKAIGLLQVPTPWTLPYLIVSAELYSEWKVASHLDRPSLVQQWVAAIEAQLQRFPKPSEGRIIVRSSGNEEGMSSRGRYYSHPGPVSDISKLLTSCLEDLERDPKIQDTRVAFIIQKFVEPRIKGHLSNERRCYEERRDWLGQTEQQGGNPQRLFSVNVRMWRHDTTGKTETPRPLECRIEEAISSNLKIVADWFYSTSEKRYHLEWVWDGAQLVIVQADEEGPTTGVDPTKSLLSLATKEDLAGLSVIQQLNASHAARYGKIRNVRIYRSLGLSTVPLFILDDQSVISAIARGDLPPALEADLRRLVVAPLVIRTDIVENDHTKKQFLKRSDELRDFAAAKKWLIETAGSFTEETRKQYALAFIFHNFIPALSSAFVYAEPNRRFVQIEGLWGLPEGLYYNSHDQYMVDTLRPKFSDAAKISSDEYTIQRKCNFKNFFVAPDASGRWTRQIVAPPFDWRSSIPKDAWLRKMAIASREIAEHEGKALSIMWFLGVADTDGGDEIMPWFHEPFDSSNIHSQPVHVRRKNIWDVSFEVLSSEDLAELESRTSGSSKETVKRIKVSPAEDHLLRDKDALQKIGMLAKRLDATIVLEGAILSHAYYQLASTGAIVEVVHPFIGFEEKQEFNKLVRDKIPERIEGLGETVVVGKLEPDALLTALKTKLIEEAYEVQNAGDAQAMLEELADIQEVILAIQRCIGSSPQELEERRIEKEEKRGGFNSGLILLSTTKGVSSTPTKQELTELAGLPLPEPGTAVAINQARLVEIAEKIDRWGDIRAGDNWQESIVTIEVPVARRNWEATTRAMRLTNTIQTIVASVSATRGGDKIHVELRARASSPDPDLFSTEQKKTKDE